MKLWKRNAIVVAIVAFVGAAVYLNWTYGQGQETVGAADPSPSGRVLGEAALVNGEANANQKDTDKAGDAQSSASPIRTGRTPPRPTLRSSRRAPATSPRRGSTASKPGTTP